jgi:DNA-directed RNA polymerase sigma subunit (sigma70/sigma32)
VHKLDHAVIDASELRQLDAATACRCRACDRLGPCIRRRQLPARQRRILQLGYGLTGKPQTLEAIGHELGLTRERVRQLQQPALVQLAQELGCELSPQGR